MGAKKLPEGIDQIPPGLYRARYRDHDGRQQGKTFLKLRNATAWRTARIAEVLEGAHGTFSDLRVIEYARQWVEARSGAHRRTTSRRWPCGWLPGQNESERAPFSFRQPPARLLAMICLNMAVSAGALMVSPRR